MSITDEAIEFTYYLMSGNTLNMQEVMKETFMHARTNDRVGIDDIKESLYVLLESKDTEYREILNRLTSPKDRNTLFCIVAEGIATGLTSSAIMKKYNLDNASSVQHSLENLSSEDPDKLNMIVRIAKGTYMLQDRMFELWIANKGQYLEQKFAASKSRFEKEKEIANSLPNIPKP